MKKIFILLPFLFVPVIIIVLRSNFFAQAQFSDLDPNQSVTFCTFDQATSGDPQACLIGSNTGHTYLRYQYTDENGDLFCQRSLCLSDINFQPFEQTCTAQQADSGDPQFCITEDNQIGQIFLRYSFTDPYGQHYCYRSECIPQTFADIPTLTPTPSEQNPNADLELCSTEQANSGDPQACSVGEYTGHSYLRYVQTDQAGNLYCQRSLCLDDFTLQPFEQTCTAQQADSGDPQFCITADNKQGYAYLRYSFTDTDGQLYCYRSSCISEFSPTLSPTLTPTITPILTRPPSKEEIAVYNLNRGTIPDQVIQQSSISDQNIISAIFNFLWNSIVGVVFYQEPRDKDKFYSQSQNLNESSVPESIQPHPGISLENLKSFLGEETGFYSITLPEFSSNLEVKDYEREFEKANFPEAVKPITPY